MRTGLPLAASLVLAQPRTRSGASQTCAGGTGRAQSVDVLKQEAMRSGAGCNGLTAFLGRNATLPVPSHGRSLPHEGPSLRRTRPGGREDDEEARKELTEKSSRRVLLQPRVPRRW